LPQWPPGPTLLYCYGKEGEIGNAERALISENHQKNSETIKLQKINTNFPKLQEIQENI
jgi:hypothetical protein